MSLKSLERVRQTLGFRLTAWYSGLFIVSVLVLFGTTYVLLAAALQRRDRDEMHAELDEYIGEYQRGGIAAAKNRADFEKTQAGKTVFFVRLADSDNTTLFRNSSQRWKRFNLDRLESKEADESRDTLMVASQPWGRFTLKRLRKQDVNDAIQWMQLPATDGDEDALEIASVRLAGGVQLQVGKSTEDREELLEEFGSFFAMVLLPVVVLGVAGGAFVARRALRPLQDLVSVVQSITTTGKLSARVPVTGSADELDELSRLFNSMLDRIALLITGMQHSLDNVAHDLRTPMTRLRGMAEMALQSDEEGEVLRDVLGSCVEESERILAMLNTLMDISEAETGTMKLDVGPVNVRDLLARSVALYREVAEEKEVAVSMTAPAALSIRADGNRMQQALANLLDNAIKYTPPGGAVQLTASPHRQHAIITVRDTGLGIAPDELSKVWDRLYRSDKSRSQRGLGLGLSLVKAIIQAHQGTVAVSSTPGQGSLFTLSLPLSLP